MEFAVALRCVATFLQSGRQAVLLRLLVQVGKCSFRVEGEKKELMSSVLVWCRAKARR